MIAQNPGTSTLEPGAMGERSRHRLAADETLDLLARQVYGDEGLWWRILDANPLVWHLFDAGVRRSLDRGTLRHGTYVLRELADRIDSQEARAVLKASGLL